MKMKENPTLIDLILCMVFFPIGLLFLFEKEAK